MMERLHESHAQLAAQGDVHNRGVVVCGLPSFQAS